MTGHDDLRHLLGGYVLGGLSPDDRARLEQHLATCSECRDELARFAPLPGLLRQAAGSVPADVPAPRSSAESAGSPDVLVQLLAEVRRRRTVRRRSMLLTAAAVVVAFAVLGTWLIRSGDSPEPSPVADQPTFIAFEPVGDWECSGEAELIEKAWGTELILTAASLPGDGPFSLEVTAADGTEQLAASWGATPAGRASVSGATSIQRSDIVSVRIVSPYGPLLDARMPP